MRSSRLVVCLVVLCATVASAQSERAGASGTPKVQTVDFTPGEIEAGRQRPVVDFAVIPERPIFERRLKLRGSFANELHRSVDALR